MKQLSYKLWGIHKQKMCLIAARTSNGKSVFAINIAYDLAKQGHKVMFLSLEMPNEKILERMLCLDQKIDNYELLKNGYNNSKEIREKFDRFNNSKIKNNLIISDCIGKDWSFIEHIFTKLTTKPDVIILDHINEIRGSYSQKQAIDEYLSKIRESCIRNNFAAIICAQVNRVAPAEKDKEPSLHHLKGSGTLEEIADQVILLHWDWHYNNEKNKNEILINIAKNRDGITGRMKMSFKPEYYLITDLEEEQKHIGKILNPWDEEEEA